MEQVSNMVSLSDEERSALEELFAEYSKAKSIREVILALGAKIAAPVGSYFYEIRYFDNTNDSENNSWSLGCYQDTKTAEAALVNWIIDEWMETGSTPWSELSSALANQEIKDEMRLIRESENPPKAYLESHTDSEIIAWYFARTNDGYEINKRRISASPEPVLGIKRKPN